MIIENCPITILTLHTYKRQLYNRFFFKHVVFYTGVVRAQGTYTLILQEVDFVLL